MNLFEETAVDDICFLKKILFIPLQIIEEL